MIIYLKQFLKDRERMCSAHGDDCEGCPVPKEVPDCCNIDYLEFIVPIVQKWSEEHPVNTYIKNLSNNFPNVDKDICYGVCVASLYGSKSRPKECGTIDCKECWDRCID